MIEDPANSILASIAKLIDVIFVPLGWGHWKATVATFTGLIAKENVVGTFGVLYDFAQNSSNELYAWEALSVDFTPLSSYSFLIFNLICAPCIAAIATIKREMGNRKWTWIAIGFQTILAYVVALIIYQIGMLIIGGSFTVLSAIGIILAITLLYLIFRPNKYLRKIKEIKA